jgi:hypothetical protein
MSTHNDAAERKRAIRQGAQRLAGLTRPLLASYLGLTPHSSPAFRERIYSTLALGEGIETFPLPGAEGGACLVHGPRHYLVKGRGSCAAFTEEAARLALFFKPPFAPEASHQCEAMVRPQGGDTARSELRSVCLARHNDYSYSLDGHPASLATTDWQHVQVLAGSWEVLMPAGAFWELVFDAGALAPDELFRCQIGIEHAARLLGRAPVTLKRHLDGGLPQAGYSRDYPGFNRQGIEEYLAYTRLFPQGLISAQQRQRWQTWQGEWREAYQLHIAQLLDIPAP